MRQFLLKEEKNNNYDNSTKWQVVAWFWEEMGLEEAWGKYDQDTTYEVF